MLISRDFLMKVGVVTPPQFWLKAHAEDTEMEYKKALAENFNNQRPAIATAVSKLAIKHGVAVFKESDIGIARHVGAKRHQYDALELQKALEAEPKSSGTLVGRSLQKLQIEVREYRLNSPLKKLRNYTSAHELAKFTRLFMKNCIIGSISSPRDWAFNRSTATSKSSHVFTIQDNHLRWESPHKEGAYDFESNKRAQDWVRQYILPIVS